MTAATAADALIGDCADMANARLGRCGNCPRRTLSATGLRVRVIKVMTVKGLKEVLKFWRNMGISKHER